MPSKEIWKDIEGYEDSYRVSDLGRVFSIRSDILLKPNINSSGYHQVCLRGSYLTIHRLVLETFDPVEDMGSLQGNHLNMIKTDNRFINLDWCTNLENQRHSWDNGREAAKGKSNGNSKLTEMDVLRIRELLQTSMLKKDIGRLFNISGENVRAIELRKSWAWL